MRRSTPPPALAMALVAATAITTAAADEPAFTAEFPIASCVFNTLGGNPYFKLVPGRQLYLTNERCVADGQCEEFKELRVTVLNETRRIPIEVNGQLRTIKARVVEEYETEDGEPVELSRNFYADCAPGADVYYFGEDVWDGDGNPSPDAWLAGQNGNRPGVIMPGGAFLLGSRYFQEIAPGIALDRAEHAAAGVLIDTPAGVFENCVEITETTPLEPGSESHKAYCPGIGMVQDGSLELKAIRRGQRGHAIPGGDD